eukprot:m.482450 g.482450  ORF g.482450 m.482450 type:complete len:429 (+) comp22548_c0_seq1:526-1812(+)
MMRVTRKIKIDPVFDKEVLQAKAAGCFVRVRKPCSHLQRLPCLGRNPLPDGQGLGVAFVVRCFDTVHLAVARHDDPGCFCPIDGSKVALQPGVLDRQQLIQLRLQVQIGIDHDPVNVSGVEAEKVEGGRARPASHDELPGVGGVAETVAKPFIVKPVGLKAIRIHLAPFLVVTGGKNVWNFGRNLLQGVEKCVTIGATIIVQVVCNVACVDGQIQITTVCPLGKRVNRCSNVSVHVGHDANREGCFTRAIGEPCLIDLAPGHHGMRLLLVIGLQHTNTVIERLPHGAVPNEYTVHQAGHTAPRFCVHRGVSALRWRIVVHLLGGPLYLAVVCRGVVTVKGSVAFVVLGCAVVEQRHPADDTAISVLGVNAPEGDGDLLAAPNRERVKGKPSPIRRRRCWRGGEYHGQRNGGCEQHRLLANKPTHGSRQ